MCEPQKVSPAIFIWWALWGGIISAFFISYGIFEFVQPSVEIPSVFGVVAFGPLAASAAARFLVLPRTSTPQKAFAIFIVGLALAEAGGFLGIILGGEQKAIYAAAAIVLMILHAPAFVKTAGTTRND